MKYCPTAATPVKDNEHFSWRKSDRYFYLKVTDRNFFIVGGFLLPPVDERGSVPERSFYRTLRTFTFYIEVCLHFCWSDDDDGDDDDDDDADDVVGDDDDDALWVLCNGETRLVQLDEGVLGAVDTLPLVGLRKATRDPVGVQVLHRELEVPDPGLVPTKGSEVWWTRQSSPAPQSPERGGQAPAAMALKGSTWTVRPREEASQAGPPRTRTRTRVRTRSRTSHSVHWTWLGLVRTPDSLPPASFLRPGPGLLPNGPASFSVPPASKA
ncbi:hypothetical protein EYF80_030974 [Liparis tanakae]|uniref:Uncharacterized protein n=1 Tax=Liparis tanakae TaxID=230148 RepID=A0A4Z2H0E0_9TELE|nr:hypothetical protein EYF80_030974 [Liparis tanakae]